MSAALSKRSQNNKKNASAQGSLKFREVSNSFWDGTRREKTRLKKVSYSLTYLLLIKLSQLEQMYRLCTFTCGCIVHSTNFLEVQIMHNYIGKKGRRFQLCHQFLAIFLLSQDVVMSLYIELDRHS